MRISGINYILYVQSFHPLLVCRMFNNSAHANPNEMKIYENTSHVSELINTNTTSIHRRAFLLVNEMELHRSKWTEFKIKLVPKNEIHPHNKTLVDI